MNFSLSAKSKIAILLTFCGYLSACQSLDGKGYFDPEIVSGNQRYVVIYDDIGIPGRAAQTAEKHCAQYGLISQFQTKGGDNYRCSGRSQNLCSTYACVK